MQAAEISETQITSHIISSNKAVISESKSQLSITDEASVPESASGDTIESGQTEGARSLVETGVTLEIFHLFPTLPPELKLKIVSIFFTFVTPFLSTKTSFKSVVCSFRSL